MQYAPLFLRKKRTVLPGGIPRIDWSNPLTAGLISAYIPSAYNKTSKIFDLTRQGVTLAVGASSAWGKTSEGVAAQGNTTNAPNGTATALQKPTAAASLYWRGLVTALGTTDTCVLFGIDFSTSNVAPFYSVAIVKNPQAGTGPDLIYIAWNQAGTYNDSGTTITVTNNIMYSIGGSFTQNGNAILYSSGVQIVSAAFGAGAITYSATSTVEMGAEKTDAGRVCNAKAMCGYMWNRALSANEQVALDADPYQFLIFPEDEMFYPSKATVGSLFTDSVTMGFLGAFSPAGLMTYNSSQNLGTNDGITSTGPMTYKPSQTLGTNDGVTATGPMTYKESDTLGSTDGASSTGLMTYKSSQSLGTNDGASTTGLMTYKESDTLGVSAGQTATGLLSIFAAASLAELSGITSSLSIQFSGNALLGALSGQTASSSMAFNQSNTLGTTESLSATNSAILLSSGSLGSTDGVSPAASATFNNPLTLASTEGATSSVTITFKDAQTLGGIAGASASNKVTFNESRSLGSTEGITAGQQATLVGSGTLGSSNSIIASPRLAFAVSETLATNETAAAVANLLMAISAILACSTDDASQIGTPPIGLLAQQLGALAGISSSSSLTINALGTLANVEGVSSTTQSTLSATGNIGSTLSLTSANIIAMVASGTIGAAAGETSQNTATAALSAFLGVQSILSLIEGLAIPVSGSIGATAGDQARGNLRIDNIAEMGTAAGLTEDAIVVLLKLISVALAGHHHVTGLTSFIYNFLNNYTLYLTPNSGGINLSNYQQHIGPGFNPNTSDLAGIDVATLQSWLATAQNAMFLLNTGASVATVSYAQGDGSKSVTYRPVDISRISAFISLIKAQLGIFGYRRRPAMPVFM